MYNLSYSFLADSSLSLYVALIFFASLILRIEFAKGTLLPSSRRNNDDLVHDNHVISAVSGCCLESIRQHNKDTAGNTVHSVRVKH